MSIQTDFVFARDFTCIVLEALPPSGEPVKEFPRNATSRQDGILLRVIPETGQPWIGRFAFGQIARTGVSRLIAMPDGHQLCVVSRGAGYIVSSTEPDTWRRVESVPIIDTVAVPSHSLVLFANYTELTAYGPLGLRWRTKRLAWDGLKLLSVTAEIVTGEYFDIRTERTETFEVDLETGESRGGAES